MKGKTLKAVREASSAELIQGGSNEVTMASITHYGAENNAKAVVR